MVYDLYRIVFIRIYLNPYSMTFAVALILQHSNGIKPIVGDRFFASKNIVQIDMIP